MRKLQVEELGQQAEQQLERNFFRRLERLADVRRFVLTWITLLVLLGGCVVAQIAALRGYYQVPGPVPGGTYSEGILGAFTNANPLYATSSADLTVSRLLFAGLLTYDADNNLIGDLAQDWSVDENNTTYTVRLKPNLKWHDGKPLTSEDVLFTYQVIQNPDAQSPLNPSWRGIEVRQVDIRTVTFTLPNQLSSFPYSLTNGIVPKHILGGEPMSSLRTLRFNTSQPIGAGPFKFNALEVSGGAADSREERIALDPFEGYHAGKPKIARFVVYIFRNQQRLVESFKAREVNAMAGLTKLPAEFENSDAHTYNLPLTAAVMIFFKMGEGSLNDGKVRQALVSATDRLAIIRNLPYPTTPVLGPLLQKQIGYNPSYAQPGLDMAAANSLLDQAGWIMGKDQVRYKAGLPLTLNLTVQANSEYEDVAAMLKQQWRRGGVDLKIVPHSNTEFQTALASHSYEALLYGITIGKDPDVLVYWDSKHADVRSENRLNFSEYKSAIADAALQAGRTRSDAALRAIKYQPFLQAWRDDAPAIALYQPRYLYITNTTIYGLSEDAINAGTDRFKNVHNWMIREKGISQTRR
ncbi:MAG TPA: peptide ABC transporter substrate-binding protein [Candidatus Saccharimonadales bacterium]|nr:peptide ABC transporter substrate-binding protein [Candidatus Saccharimonadales bacterium]